MKEIKKLSAPGLYQAPSCEIFSVRTEGVLCQSVNFNTNALTNGQSGWFEDEE